jgi:hypothetical protein
MSGEILCRAVRDSRSGKVYMKNIVIDVAGQFNRVWPIRAKTIENEVWSNYRSVAHFWAAYQTCHAEAGGKYPFPCAFQDLAGFLGTAEAFRRLGECAKTNQGTVLRAGDAIRLPDNLGVPDIHLAFE